MIRWIAMLLLLANTAWAIGPVFSDGGPDAEGYGKSIGYPAGPRAAAP